MRVHYAMVSTISEITVQIKGTAPVFWDKAKCVVQVGCGS